MDLSQPGLSQFKPEGVLGILVRLSPQTVGWRISCHQHDSWAEDVANQWLVTNNPNITEELQTQDHTCVFDILPDGLVLLGIVHNVSGYRLPVLFEAKVAELSRWRYRQT